MKKILSKIVLMLFILCIIASIVFVFTVGFLPEIEDPGRPMLDSLFPEWFLRITTLIIIGPIFFIPTVLLGIAYFKIKRGMQPKGVNCN